MMKKYRRFSCLIVFVCIICFPLNALNNIVLKEDFSFNGKAMMYYTTENIDSNTQITACAWSLMGKITESGRSVSFLLVDTESAETLVFKEWNSPVDVVMQISDKGETSYLVQDKDSIYLRIFKMQGDATAIQLYSYSNKGESNNTLSSESNNDKQENVDDGWTIIPYEADDLKGNDAYTSYMFTQEGMGSFVFWGFEKTQFRIISDDGIFNYETIGAYTGQQAFVGIYDENNNLVKKFKMWLDREDSKGGHVLRTRNSGALFNPTNQSGKVTRIFDALQADKGYVRIVVQRYNRTDFDLKITPIKNALEVK